MNKKQILESLEKYHLDPTQYIVISGAALVLHGIKEETHDIDISVTKELYQKLEKEYQCEVEKYDETAQCNIYYIDRILNFSTNFYDEKNYVYIDGIRVQDIHGIIELKKKLNRAKDQRDLRKIEEFLKRN